MHMRTRIAFVIGWLLLGILPAQGSEIVKTTYGMVQGTSEGQVTVYKGVPFAAPPIGNLRWRAPRPAIAWNGVLKADEFKPMCMTSAPSIPGGPMEKVSEDCLYLNIWAPTRQSKSKLPVMVWIYGGGERAGSGSSPVYWGDRLADKKGVITVNLSYRVGTFGFLAHPDLSRESGYGTSGNYGVMDMVAALQWVHDNIAAFGGDPRNVTIFGQSGGSFEVGHLMISPLAHGLFQRAIGESSADMGAAGAGGGLIFPKDAEASGVRWAAGFGAKSISELREVRADKLEAADSQWPADATGKVKGNGQSGSIGVLDGYVFPQPMYETFESKKQNDVPLLIGYNANEAGDMLGAPLAAAAYRESVKSEYGVFASKILELYPATTDAVAARSQLALMRDSWFGWHMWTWAKLQSITGRGHVYFYNFSYVPHYPPDSPLAAMGAAHGFELGDVFDHVNYLPSTATESDKRVMEIISTYWTNFAKTGNPNGAGLPRWPIFTSDHQRVMNLGDPIMDSEIARQDLRRLKLLDAIYAEQRKSVALMVKDLGERENKVR